MIISFAPANFFYESELYNEFGLPQISIGFISISAKEILLVILVIKSLVKPKNKNLLPFRTILVVTFIYILFLIPFSVLTYEGDLVRILKDYRYVFIYLLILPLIRLVNSIQDVEKIIELVMPFSILSFFGAIYFFLSGNYLINNIAPGMISKMTLGMGLGGDRFITVSGEHMLLFFTFTFSGFLYLKNNSMNKANIIYIFYALISFITILLTATRVWFLVFLIVLIGILLLTRRKFKSLPVFFVTSLILLLIFLNIPKIHTGIVNSFNRISTLTEVAEEGSIGNENLENRLESRWPRFVISFKINPITGLGSSKLYKTYSPGSDLGNFNLIAQGGLIGFTLFLIIWIKFLTFFRKINNRINRNNPFKHTILFFNIALLALLTAHFTTHQIFWIVPPFADTVLLVSLIAFSWRYAEEALYRDRLIRLNSLRT